MKNLDRERLGPVEVAHDHPEDPRNKLLRHFSMESPEILNVYRGNAVLDASGEATITLPSYFDAINTNVSYRLTAVGKPAPGLYVKSEIAERSFAVAGGTPGLKVSWVVYAERNDPYVKQTKGVRDVVVEKEGSEKGKYLMPQLYGAPRSEAMIAPEPAEAIKDR